MGNAYNLNQNVVAVQYDEHSKPTFMQRTKNFFGRAKQSLAVGVAGASGLVLTQNAVAAELDFSGATEELGGVKTTLVAIIGTLVVLVGIGLAWKYFKRTAH